MLFFATLPSMDTLDIKTSFGRSVVILIVVIATVLLYQSFIADASKNEFAPKEGQACRGIALVVDYPFYGGMLQPHACKPQCEDGVQRYIVYTNGKATQCQTVPGCLDWGEDQGVTCIPPKEI